MKTMKKAVIAAIVVLIALFLVTCEDFLLNPQAKEDEVEYFDWQYEEQPEGGGRLTLMLDGSTPFAHKKLNQRALNEEMAKMAHDYFEVIFVNGSLAVDTNNNITTAGSTVARASWEIGQPAGISGVPRGTGGIDYGPVYPTSNGPAAVIFVGKKTGKTLLGIGHLVQVNEGATILSGASLITPGATAVTFGVYPLKTNVGWYDHDSDSDAPNPSAEVLRGSATNTLGYTDVTFQTATTQKSITTPLGAPTPTKTIGGNITLRGGLKFPLYTLPDAIDARTIDAYYIISGMASAATGEYNGVAKPPLLSSARIIGTAFTDTTKNLGIEIIKRTPSYITGGQTLDAAGAIDTYTTVKPLSHLFANANSGFDYDDANAAYDDISGTVIAMQFIQRKDADGESSGIFAITFQCPVYAITQANATNNGPGPEKWYIRPGYQQYQYLLDNGKDAGGMVMLGTNAGDVDWLEIWTVGIGFSN